MTKKRKAEGGPSNDLPTSKKHVSNNSRPQPWMAKIDTLHSYSRLLENTSEALERKKLGDRMRETLEGLRRELDSFQGTEAVPKRPVNEGSSKSLPTLPSIQDPDLKKCVFTHQGALDVNANSSDARSYERLELLGDSYIEVIATRLLWDRFNHLPTGRLAQIRENLVKNQTLAQYTVRYGLDKHIKLAVGFVPEPKTMQKIRGDVLEAYVAAIVVDDPVSGFERAETWLHQLWEPELRHIATPSDVNMNAKEELSRNIATNNVKIEYLDERPPQKLSKPLINYFVGVYLTGWGWENQHLGSGTGLNKKAAGNKAAMAAMDNHPLIDEIMKAKQESHEKAKREYDEKTQKEKKAPATEKTNGITDTTEPR